MSPPPTIFADEKEKPDSPPTATSIHDAEVTTIQSKKILRRIDMFLLPMLVVSYIFQFLDKTSLGNTAVLGIMQDVKLVGQEFSWLNSAFYFGYLVANYPVSIILVKYPLGKTIAISVLIWAMILGCHGVGQNFVGLCVLRVLLGVFESTISPGLSLMTGMWYKPSEHASRYGIWFLGNSLGGLASPLIAYAISFIHGGPLEPWRWVFVILGIATALWGLVLLFALPDSPRTAWFLQPDDQLIAYQRPQHYQKSFKTNKYSHEQFIEAMKDPKTWFFFIIMMISSLSNGVVSNFTSLIISGLGYNTRTTLLLGMPLSAFQFVAVLLSTWLASKIPKSRCFIVMASNAIGLVGVLLIQKLPVNMQGGRYVGVVLLLATTNIFPLMLSLTSSNVSGFTKKSTVNAMFFIGYCAGNIGGPQLFVTKEAPTYNTAFTGLLCIYCITIGLVFIFRQYLSWENKRRDRVQGVQIDVRVRDSSLQPTWGADDEQIDETDWMNEEFRYYL